MAVPQTEPMAGGRRGPGPARAPAEGRGWAWGGVLTALAGLLVIVTAGPLWPYDEADIRDSARMVGRFDGATAWWVFATQIAFTAAALGAVVFAAGLRRRLDRQCPAGSLVPALAASGLLLVAVMNLVGAGMGTEMFHDITNRDATDPDMIISGMTQLGTYGWLWSGLLLTAGALVVAAFRQGAVSRWIGVISALFGFLLLITQVTPFQYMALFVGFPYLLVLGAAFAFGRTRTTE
ncbi:hypothetical protein [Streptomyces sp. NBC_00872]|uniref:hypothetical protein n=2 Tax=unclassified Streptomyces TaxID=2593676 RepID=UPI00386884F1|nr:hypothetical protein OG214_01305 [Streptomyces sp. NBC_00872]